jgi:GNAT superfamily N-acetyltransferase
MLRRLALPVTLESPAGPLILRRAVERDLDSILALLADDPVTAARGSADGDRSLYTAALRSIIGDPSNDLLVLHDLTATMQLTTIPGLSRAAATRLQVEAVRVAGDRRSRGIGGALLRWVVDAAAPALGATHVQLTTDSTRTDARRFYEGLGFTASHVGFKYDV